jgi:hypothetical protein
LAFQDDGYVSGAGKQSAGEMSFRFLTQMLSTEESFRLIPFNAALPSRPINEVLLVRVNATRDFCVADTTGRHPFIFLRRARYSVAFFPSKSWLFAAASATNAVYVELRLRR